MDDGSSRERCLVISNRRDRDGEDAAQCAWRGFYAATGYHLGSLKPLMH
jgi:hypothetical protein